MSTPVEVLEAEVLALPRDERSRLLDRLIASLDTDPTLRDVWLLEATRRESELTNGSVNPVSGPETLARLRAQLR